MSSFESVLSKEDIDYIFSLSEVQTAKQKLDTQENGKIYFTIELTDSICSALHTRFGLDFSVGKRLPMRWIKGDTAPHIDHGQSEFENTYLVYLNDSPGEFLIGDSSYPIAANTGYVFSEGVHHSTAHTGSAPRLLLGPMNEFAEPVGISVVFYYPSEGDAILNTNLITAYGNYTIQLVSGYTHWRIASTSTGPDPQNVVYTVGNTLTGNGTTDFYYIYPTAPCFLEGTTILCEVDGVEKYVPVETLTKDSRVKTSRDGFKKVVALGKGEIINPGNDERIEDRLYKCSPSNYPALKTDLYITGCHSILEFPISEKQKEDSIKRQGKLFITDKKYRLMACVDERAEPWNSEGTYAIYHFALENEDDGMNYGVYANGGLLVETCAIRTLLKRSNMKIIH
jgi:hypothetical protein